MAKRKAAEQATDPASQNQAAAAAETAGPPNDAAIDGPAVDPKKIKQLLATPIECVALDSIGRDPHNAMDHPDRNLEDIRRSLRRFGQVEPLLVWRDTIIHGSGRHEAMQAEGWGQCEIRRCDHLSEWEARALAIAMNRTAESSQWNWQALSEQLKAFQSEGLDDLLRNIGWNEEELKPLLTAEWGASNEVDLGGDGGVPAGFAAGDQFTTDRKFVAVIPMTEEQANDEGIKTAIHELATRHGLEFRIRPA